MTISIQTEFQFEIGDYGVDDLGSTEINLWLSRGVKAFNQEFPRRYTSTEDSSVVSETLTARDQEIIVLLAVEKWLNTEQRKAASNALAYSNVAGRTDLTRVPEAFRNAKADIRARIDALRKRDEHDAVIGDIDKHRLNLYQDLLGDTS